MNRVKQQVHAIQVYRSGYTGRNVRIVILDTGVYLHKDISRRVVLFRNFAGANQSCHDDNGHGTHVAGIIAGEGLSSMGQIKGMAPGAELVVLKVLDAYGNGQTSRVLEALQWIKENHLRYHIRILNFSIGFLAGAKDKDQLKIVNALEELWDENIVVVTAAGNNGPREGSITVPGISKKVITVGAYDDDLSNRLPRGYSGKGPTSCCIVKPEILAPGTDILSLSNRGMRYEYKSGTSMATPIVSGALALALEKRPGIEAWQLKLKLYEMNESDEKVEQAWGILNVDKLMNIL